MTFWEWFTALASAASIISLGGIVSAIYNGRATRRVIQEMREDTQVRFDGTQQLIAELHANALAVPERMDQRAEERHRERRG